MWSRWSRWYPRRVEGAGLPCDDLRFLCQDARGIKSRL